MRILSFLLVAAAATGVPALAQSGSLPGRNITPPVVSGSWKSAPGLGRHHEFRRGPGRHDGRRGRHHGRFGRGGFVVPFGGTGLFDSDETPDPHGTGFFAGSGGQVRMQSGRPHYDYDRSYPYEWASAAGGREGWVWDVAEAGHSERCTAEHGVRVCRSGR